MENFNIFDVERVGARSKVSLQYIVAMIKGSNRITQDEGEDVIRECETMLPVLENRNAKILKRIKEKGYYAQYIGELREIIVSKVARERGNKQWKSIFMALTSFILLGTKRFEVFKGVSFPISDDEWDYAIEFGFYLAKPDIYFSDSIPAFKMHLDECIPYIWFCLIFKHAMSELENRDNVENRFQELAELCTQNSKLKDTIDNLTLQLRDEKRRTEREKDAAAEQAKRAAQEEEKAKSARIIRELRYALAQSEKRIAELTSQFSELSEHHVDGPEYPQQEKFMQDIQAMGESAQNSPSINIMLPEQGVAFVSKCESLIKRVQGLHPDWTFVSSETMAYIDSSVKLVFIDSKHIGHSFVSKVRAQCSQDTEVVLLSKRNIDCLELEMKTRYKNILVNMSA